jgi:hypothetical protein
MASMKFNDLEVETVVMAKDVAVAGDVDVAHSEEIEDEVVVGRVQHEADVALTSLKSPKSGVSRLSHS